MKSMTLLAGALLVIAGGAPAEGGAGARATLRDAEGKTAGKATLEETAHGVLIHLDLTAVPPGTRAFHIHAVGKCEPPFDSAGGHFNPGGKQHGIRNPEGMHAGDFPNLEVPESGMLKVTVLARDVTLGEGSHSLFDADGSALVIHAGPDDYSTDPAGNAGARIVCGVIEK
jgi:Cu-Zn family superoxide dismutase